MLCRKSWCIPFFLIFLSVVGNDSHSRADNTDISLDNLIAKIQGISGIRTSFVQITDIPMFTQPIRVHGILLYSRPSALLWEYQKPFLDGFSLKNGKIVRWENSRSNTIGKERGQDPVAELIADNLMAWISLDLGKIQQQYSVVVTKSTPITLHLVPKNKSLREVVAGLEITFQDNGIASSVVLREARGGSTSITFVDTVINGTIDPAEFPQ